MPITIAVNIDGKDVVAAGSVVCGQKDTVTLTVYDLDYRIKFSTNESGQLKADLSQPNPTSLEITLFNFDNPLGSAWGGNVGNVTERQLWLHIFVHSIGEGDTSIKLMNYSFVLEAARRGQ